MTDGQSELHRQIAEQNAVAALASEPPKCPWCNTAKHTRMIDYHHYYCGRCKNEFDPTEDGTTGYGRPDRNAERREEFQIREQQRRARRC